MPDFYQGTELWNFSPVDPDNRRRVDFDKCVRLLEEIKTREVSALEDMLTDLVSNWHDGRIKLYLTRKALNFRSAHKDLFGSEEYIPLEMTGQRRDRVVAFARRRRREWAIVAVPRLIAELLRSQKSAQRRSAFPALRVMLPAEFPDEWKNVVTEGAVVARPAADGHKTLSLSKMLECFPAILLAPCEE